MSVPSIDSRRGSPTYELETEYESRSPFWTDYSGGVILQVVSETVQSFLDPKFLVTIISIVFIGGMNWQLQKSTADQLRGEIEELKILPAAVQAMRESAIRQENKVAGVDLNATRLSQMTDRINEMAKTLTLLDQESSLRDREVVELRLASGDRIKKSELLTWISKFNKNNPALEVPDLMD